MVFSARLRRSRTAVSGFSRRNPVIGFKHVSTEYKHLVQVQKNLQSRRKNLKSRVDILKLNKTGKVQQKYKIQNNKQKLQQACQELERTSRLHVHNRRGISVENAEQQKSMNFLNLEKSRHKKMLENMKNKIQKEKILIQEYQKTIKITKSKILEHLKKRDEALKVFTTVQKQIKVEKQKIFKLKYQLQQTINKYV